MTLNNVTPLTDAARLQLLLSWINGDPFERVIIRQRLAQFLAPV